MNHPYHILLFGSEEAPLQFNPTAVMDDLLQNQMAKEEFKERKENNRAKKESKVQEWTRPEVTLDLMEDLGKGIIVCSKIVMPKTQILSIPHQN